MRCLTLILLLAALSQAADEADLRRLLTEAFESQAKTVRIPPGTYRLGHEPDGKTNLRFEGVHDLVVDGTGVSLIATGKPTSIVTLHNCRNVTLKGFTVDCDPLLFTQGTIEAMDPGGLWYDLRIEDGYRTDLAQIGHARPLSVFDPKTRRYKDGVQDCYLGGIERGANGLWRVLPVKEVIGRHRLPTKTVQVGDLWMIAGWGGGPAFTARDCADITYEDITVYQAGAMGFHEHAGEGGTTLRRCRVMLKPGTTRLLSTNADGFHCKNMHRPPVVEDCLFEGMHDDGINIHGMYSRVLTKPADGKLVVAPIFLQWGSPGDLVEFFRQSDGVSLGRFPLTAVEKVEAKAYAELRRQHGPGFGYGLDYRLGIDGAPAVQPGDAMISTNYCGSGFVIRRNTFRNHRYRAILIRAEHGVIEDNLIDGCSNDAMVLAPSLYSEGGFVRDVVVRSNTIRNVGMLPWHQAAIRVGLEGGQATCRENRRIVLEGNRIEQPGRDAFRISNAEDVTLRSNVVVGVGRRPAPGAPGVLLRIGQAGKVTATGNRYEDTLAEHAQVVVDATADAATVDAPAWTELR